MSIKDKQEMIQAINDTEVLEKLKSYLEAAVDHEKVLAAKGSNNLSDGERLWLLAFKGAHAKLDETKDDYWEDIVLLLNIRES